MVEKYSPPVREGEVVRNQRCIAIGAKGDGIFRKDGFVIICPGTEEGENYDLRITRVIPKMAFAEKA